MTLDEIVAKCRAEGIVSIETHPDGSIAKLQFGPARTQKKEPTPAEKVVADKLKREPRIDSMELAEKLLNDISAEKNA